MRGKHQAVAGMKPIISVVTTGASKTFAELLGSDINAKTQKITVIPQATGVYMASGEASVASHPLGGDSVEIPGTRESLDEIEFYSASALSMTVIQWG